MTTIFDVLDKAGKINRPKSRNAGRYAKGKKAERKYGTKTPTDDQIRAEALRSRNIAIQQRKLGVKPKAKPAGSKSKPKIIKPKTTKPKKDKPVKVKPTTAQYLSGQTPTNRRNAEANIAGRTSNSAVGRGDSYGSAARAVGSRKKSLDEIQGFLEGMLQVSKNEQSTQARMTGNNLDTKIRQDKQEGKIRDKPKEVKTGDKFNLETRIGDPALRKATCRLWKTELNETFNNLLDNFQTLYKDTYSDNKFNEAEGKGKKKPITNTGRSGKGSLGGDTQAQPKAIGESRSDQSVMQS